MLKGRMLGLAIALASAWFVAPECLAADQLTQDTVERYLADVDFRLLQVSGGKSPEDGLKEIETAFKAAMFTAKGHEDLANALKSHYAKARTVMQSRDMRWEREKVGLREASEMVKTELSLIP